MYQQFCEFCQILRKSKHSLKSNTDTVIYQDETYFGFHDINKATAVQHVLICTKNHIQTALQISKSEQLFQMKKVGIKVLNQLCAGKQMDEQKDYRFGFHLRPFNTISHVHLHCFVLPFKSYIIDKIVYGWMLKSVQQVVRKLQLSANPKM